MTRVIIPTGGRNLNISLRGVYSYASLRIDSTTEAIPFLEAYVVRTFVGYLNGYDWGSTCITNMKEGNLILKRRFYLSKALFYPVR